jgi:pimeloyl-ACP methyl ester carboxylesterase
MTKTFVLVHGAWHGGWCWRRVADLLQKQGHKVFAPTLTGLGERAHLLGPGIGLSTHIADVVNVFKYERLADVVLCGHSYGGMVISGVAEQVQKAIRSIVFLDAFMPENGEAIIDLTSAAVQEALRGAREKGAIGIPPRPAAAFGVNEKDRAWVDAMCGPQPIATFSDPIALTGARERIGTKAYIRASAYASVAFDAARDKLKTDPSWRIYDIPCGHDVMLDMPDRLADVLLELI